MSETPEKIKIGLAGTSWWADAMYLPALASHPLAEVRAVCGRNPSRASALAEQWGISNYYTNYSEMVEQEPLDAMVVATSNDTHFPFAMAALQKKLHVLCEKPLALTVKEAEEMAQAAAGQHAKTLVPFTYRFMPTNRFLKRLLDDGFIGRPYHLAMRYYTGYGREGNYLWRFDQAKAGTGVIGDLGSHFLYLARWYFGEIAAVTCQTGRFVERPDLTPESEPYIKLEDSAYFLLDFASGAQGSVHVTCVAHEQTAFGQRHFMEFHGSDGTLYMQTDWDTIQSVQGARAPHGRLETLPIPDDIWGQARRDTVHNTYRDIFRNDLLMIGEWVSAVAHDTPVKPDFADGLAIQKIMAAAVESSRTDRKISLT